MKKEFIPYEQALALKELGFKGSSFAYYIENRGIAGTGSDIELVYEHIHDTESFGNLICRVPTYSQAFRWFREAYSLLNHLTTHLNPYGEDGALEESYGYRIMFNKDGWKCDVWEELIFEQSLLEATW